MSLRRLVFGLISHGAVFAIGFALGIYMLPILTAPEGPSNETLEQQSQQALFSGEFTRDLRGSDFLHWGEGKVSVTATNIVHKGALAPGPDYKLYLTNQFVEHEDEFNPIKAEAMRLGDIKTFNGFILDIPDNVDVSQYNTIVIWCETFSEFITAAKYR